jgi:hypothetical protein
LDHLGELKYWQHLNHLAHLNPFEPNVVQFN